MTATIGQISIFTALLLAIWGIIAPIIGSRTERSGFLASTRAAIIGQFVLVTVASLSLIYALVATDFSLRYVASNTTRATPFYYDSNHLFRLGRLDL